MELKQHSEAEIYTVLWQRRGIIVYKHVLVNKKEENSEYIFLSQFSEAVRQRKIETGKYILIKSEALAEDFIIFEQNEKGIEEDPLTWSVEMNEAQPSSFQLTKSIDIPK